MSGKFGKKIVAIVILLNLIFTEQVLYLCAKSAEVPDTLIVAWFTFTGTELLSLAVIKVKKIKNDSQGKEKKNNDKI
jgi:hypothetical protein